MFNHSSSQLDEVALWPVTKNHRLPFGSDKTNLTVTQMFACVDEFGYDGDLDVDGYVDGDVDVDVDVDGYADGDDVDNGPPFASE